MANLNRCQAQDIIHRGDYDPTDYRGVYELHLQAGYSIEQARKAQSRAAQLLADRKVAEATASRGKR